MGEKINRIIQGLKELKIVGMEILTSIAHLVATVPKAILIVTGIIVEFDTIDELKAIVEEILAYLRNKNKVYKKDAGI